MKCRLCLLECSKGKAVNIFCDNEGRDGANLIEKHLLIQVQQSDPYSTTICQICLNHLEDFHKFFQHIEQRQKLLQAELKTIRGDAIHEELLLDIKQLIPDAETGTENPLSPTLCIPDNLESENNEKSSLPSKGTSIFNVETSTRTLRPFRKCEIKPNLNSTDGNASNSVPERVEEPKDVKPIEIAEEEKLGDELIAKYIELKCELCTARMDTFKSLKVHYRKEHNIDGFVQCCGNRFRLRCLLLDHLQFHLNPERFKCEICNKVLKTRKLLEHHKVHKHSDRQELKHACTFCDKKFACSSILNSHLLVHTKERNHKCEKCCKRFKTENFLKAHMKTHLEKNPFVCETCGRVYRSKMSFERHVAEHEGRLKEPGDNCSTCGKWFTFDGLQRHVRSHKLEDVECGLCGKVVKSKNALRGHMDYVHRMQQILSCSVCEKTFKRASVFKEHIAMHAGRKDFACIHCSREFRSKANMYAHIKKVHMEEWAKAQLLRFKEPEQAQNSQGKKETCIK